MYRSARGFTLMELMIVIALAAMIMGLGVPAFRDFARNGRLTGAANEFLVTLVTARNEAVRRQTIVSVCPSDTPDSATATCDIGATAGYIAFIDEDALCDVADSDDLVANFVVHGEVSSAGNASCISFGANGFRRVITGQPATAYALFCDERGATAVPGTLNDTSFARGVEILPTGRAAVSRVQTELASWASATDPVSCP
jgi:type IV fimbrial biogenesis protein FimT